MLVDTSVWSLALRRRVDALHRDQRAVRKALEELVVDGRVVMIGPVRQELLSGIRDDAAFERLRGRLRPFDDEPLVCDDYEVAAKSSNACRRRGIAAASTDMLICATAERRNLAIFSTDRDFERYATVLPIRLWRR